MKKNRVLIKKDILKYFLPSLIIVFLISLGACFLDNAFGVTEFLFEDLTDARSIVMDFFLVEIQVTFIVVSLSTALSTQSKRVYWVDSFQYRLIKPKITNFTALSSYILATLIVGIVWEILDRCLKNFGGMMGIMASFVLSLVFMIILSMRMIGANFGEEAIKRELEDELRKRLQEQKITEHIGYDKGLRIPEVRELVQVTFQEIEEKKLDLVCENLDLLLRLRFPHELKRCYDYAKKSLQSPEIMEEIDFSLMRKAIRDNESSFFFMDCPLSTDSLIRWWDEMIDERFDEAVILWQEGKKDEAMRIRRELYTLFAESMWYRVRDEIDDLDDQDDKTNDRRYRIIYMMGYFVERRTDARGVFDRDFEFIPLGKDWGVSEKESITDESTLEDAASLVLFAKNTLDHWREKGCSEDIEMYMDADMGTLYDSLNF
ncbi:MAG: hypothetical protein K6A74_06095 [Lachnospiraceae bacterium]|nr:hypothetical protein [Lachnospiraceae bacterium]